MKLKTFLFALPLLFATLSMVSCGDDAEEVTPPDSEEVETYVGWTHLTTNFLNKDYTNDTISVALVADGSLTLTFTDATWGVATITGVQIQAMADETGYSLNGGEGNFVMNNPRTGTTQTFPCQLEEGTLSNDKQQMYAVISAYMETGHGNMTFTFHGTPSAE